MTMGDRIVVMKDGLIQQIDTPQKLYDYPVNVFVAGFIGSPQMNFMDGKLVKEGNDYFVEVHGDKLHIDPSKVNNNVVAYVGKTIKVGIRPEDIYDDGAFLKANPKAVIDTTVEVSELMGSEVYLYLNYKGERLTARVVPTTTSGRGSQVKVGVDTTKLHLFDAETELAIMN
jgi:multiple sugar transport system ATP-binding protein